MTNSAINENQLIFHEVKAYKNCAKYSTFNITRGVAHITFHILFVIYDAILVKNIASYSVFISTYFRYTCILNPIEITIYKNVPKTITPELDYC